VDIFVKLTQEDQLIGSFANDNKFQVYIIKGAFLNG
jgi:hypothetical protein